MPLSGESATASESEQSNCHSTVALRSNIETRATLCLPSSNVKWDGREINLDGEWLESLNDPKELTTGKRLRLPWPEKGEEKYWNANVQS